MTVLNPIAVFDRCAVCTRRVTVGSFVSIHEDDARGRVVCSECVRAIVAKARPAVLPMARVSTVNAVAGPQTATPRGVR